MLYLYLEKMRSLSLVGFLFASLTGLWMLSFIILSRIKLLILAIYCLPGPARMEEPVKIIIYKLVCLFYFNFIIIIKVIRLYWIIRFIFWILCRVRYMIMCSRRQIRWFCLKLLIERLRLIIFIKYELKFEKRYLKWVFYIYIY